MRKFKTVILFLLLTISLIAQTITRKVLYVNDGDPLTIEMQKEKIRFYGIDAPEISQPGGLESKKRETKKVTLLSEGSGDSVYVTKSGKKYHREGCKYSS